jgi:hypothetical protein
LRVAPSIEGKGKGNREHVNASYYYEPVSLGR